MKTVKQLEPIVYQYLKNGLNADLIFHCVEHTRWVVREVSKICEYENIEEKRASFIYLSALCHDTGYVKMNNKNEPLGAEFAVGLMKKEGYNTDEINCVTHCILETDPDVRCSSHESEILSDADLGYIGTDGFLEWSNKLYKEYLNLGVISGNKKEWIEIQIEFFLKHKYHSDFSKKYRLPTKMKNLKKLQNQLEKLN